MNILFYFPRRDDNKQNIDIMKRRVMSMVEENNNLSKSTGKLGQEVFLLLVPFWAAYSEEWHVAGH